MLVLELGFLLGLFWLAYQGIRVALLLVRLVVSILVGWPRKGYTELMGGNHEPPAGVTGLSLHSLVRTRLRRRSRWVCSLQALFRGEVGSVSALISGRWAPDLPADSRGPVVNFAAAFFEEGVQILGGGSVPGEEVGKRIVYVHLRRLDGSEWTVFPELLAALSDRALFRERGGSLLALLRLKALEWRKSVGIPHHRFSFGFADTLTLACQLSSWATRAESCLRESGQALLVDY